MPRLHAEAGGKLHGCLWCCRAELREKRVVYETLYYVVYLSRLLLLGIIFLLWVGGHQELLLVTI